MPGPDSGRARKRHVFFALAIGPHVHMFASCLLKHTSTMCTTLMFLFAILGRRQVEFPPLRPRLPGDPLPAAPPALVHRGHGALVGHPAGFAGAPGGVLARRRGGAGGYSRRLICGSRHQHAALCTGKRISGASGCKRSRIPQHDGPTRKHWTASASPSWMSSCSTRVARPLPLVPGCCRDHAWL